MWQRVRGGRKERNPYGRSRIIGFWLVLFWVFLASSVAAATEIQPLASDPQLPRASKLKPGKIVRGPDGASILVPPVRKSEGTTAPAMSLSPPNSPINTSTETNPNASASAPEAAPPLSPIAESPETPASTDVPTSEDEAPGLPPPGQSKDVSLHRLPSGVLAAVPRTPKTLKVCPPT